MGNGKPLVIAFAVGGTIGYLAGRPKRGTMRSSFSLSNLLTCGFLGVMVWQIMGDSKRKIIKVRVNETVGMMRAEVAKIGEPAWISELRNHATDVGKDAVPNISIELP